MSIDIVRAHENLRTFDFQRLFIDHLGWNHATGVSKTTWDVQGMPVTRTAIAELSGVIVFEIRTADGEIPDAAAQRSIHSAIAHYHHENLLIFLDATRKSSVWYWVKRDGGKSYPRSHSYVYGQPGDLLIGKLSAMFVDIGELDPNTGRLPLIEAIGRVRQALDVEPVTKRFFSDFQCLHGTLLRAIRGISDERDRRWYASVLLNRLMFVYFLQRRGFLDGGNHWYLQQKLAASQQRAPDQYYPEFLRTLFFEGFAKPVAERSATASALIGQICYLNGGLFLPHQVEQANPTIAVPDAVFGEIFSLFDGYDWVLDDSPTGNEREINPAVLGYIFEKYINQKAFGAYYTRSEITEYLCEQTIHRLVLDRINRRRSASKKPYQRVSDLLIKPDVDEIRFLLLSDEGLSGLKLIDPACGSGAFLVAAMRTLINVYSALVGKAEFAGDSTLDAWLARVKREHPSIDYYIKKQIILNNLFGVDIMAEAIEIARLRLFLALVAAARTVDDLEPLPNIDFNILAGNALIGLLRVDTQRADAALLVHGKDGSQAEQLGLFADTQRNSYAEIVAEKNRLVRSYRHAAETLNSVDLSALRDDIQRHRIEAAAVLDELLLNDFQALKIRYEQATWDAAKGKEGKPTRRPLTIDDIRALQPFHWGYEFDEVMNERGGFDAIIANPPWEVFKPNAKEFFTDFSNLVSKKKMKIEEFEAEQVKLLIDTEVLKAWLEYLSRFPYQNQFFRLSSQYQHQSALIDGKKSGTDINFYKLFTEQCYNLLHPSGQCGIVLPSGIYTDLGTKQLRELLFSETQIGGLFCMENRREIFEGVHRSFKIVVLTFEKGGATSNFPSAFMRHDVAELASFPSYGGIELSVELIRRLSPDSLSVMEFKSELDIAIANKMLRLPTLSEKIQNTWEFDLSREFHMTDDSGLFRQSPAPHHFALFEGKMIHQQDFRFNSHGYT